MRRQQQIIIHSNKCKLVISILSCNYIDRLLNDIIIMKGLILMLIPLLSLSISAELVLGQGQEGRGGRNLRAEFEQMMLNWCPPNQKSTYCKKVRG